MVVFCCEISGKICHTESVLCAVVYFTGLSTFPWAVIRVTPAQAFSECHVIWIPKTSYVQKGGDSIVLRQMFHVM